VNFYIDGQGGDGGWWMRGRTEERRRGRKGGQRVKEMSRDLNGEGMDEEKKNWDR